jgi:RNA-directed DNA polymerase
MAKRMFTHTYESITSTDNLLDAWYEFLRGKRNRKDVQMFQQNLIENIKTLHADLVSERYRHGAYEAFKVNDPKPRDIHKASVRDRLLHHAMYRKLYPFFNRTFIADSYSCREGKGTHKAMNRFRAFAYKVSKNNTRTAWVLKCDIKKFFANIDHQILKDILAQYIPDPCTLSLFSRIIDSFSTTYGSRTSVYKASLTCLAGLPLGNLTSQLLVNIYMNAFDQFAKHILKARHYIRYADDFVFLHEDKKHLLNIIPRIKEFLSESLKLSLHPDKLHLRTLASGGDFLGWVHFPDHRVLRTASKNRMWRRIAETGGKEETISSYLGMLRWGNAWKLQEQVKNYGTIEYVPGINAHEPPAPE